MHGMVCTSPAAAGRWQVRIGGHEEEGKSGETDRQRERREVEGELDSGSVDSCG